MVVIHNMATFYLVTKLEPGDRRKCEETVTERRMTEGRKTIRSMTECRMKVDKD